MSGSNVHHCIAFKLDPFTLLAAKLLETDAIAAERQDRIEREDADARYTREREERGSAALDAFRTATTPDQEVRARAMLREIAR